MHFLKKMVAIAALISIAFSSVLYVAPINASSQEQQENESSTDKTSNGVNAEELNFTASISDSTVDVGQVVRITAEFTYNHPDGWESPPEDASWTTDPGLTDVYMRINNLMGNGFSRPDGGFNISYSVATNSNYSLILLNNYTPDNYIYLYNPCATVGKFGAYWGDRVTVSWDVMIDETFNTSIEGESLDLSLELWCESLSRTSRADNPEYEPFNLYAETTVKAVLNDAVQDGDYGTFNVSLTDAGAAGSSFESNSPLSGGTFVLCNVATGINLPGMEEPIESLTYYHENENGEIEWVDIGNRSIEDALEEGLITKKTTDSNGHLSFQKDESWSGDNKRLIEIKAPENYIAPKNLEIECTEAGAVSPPSSGGNHDDDWHTKVNDTVYVENINVQPDVSKSVSQENVAVGDTLEYSSNISAPSNNNAYAKIDSSYYALYHNDLRPQEYEMYSLDDFSTSLILYDSMNGATLNRINNIEDIENDLVTTPFNESELSDAVIYGDSDNIKSMLTSINGYDEGYEGFSFRLNDFSPGSELNLTYLASVSDSASLLDSNPNTITAIYQVYDEDQMIFSSASASAGFYLTSSLTTLVVHNIDMISNPLTGGAFVVYKVADNNTRLYYYLNSETQEVEWVDIGSKSPKTAAENGEITFGSTDEIGNVAFPSLSPDTYFVEQVVAPSGYLPMEYDVAAEVTASTGAMMEVNAVNTVGSILPETGGPGTALITMMGLLLMAGAVTIYLTQRKRHQS